MERDVAGAIISSGNGHLLTGWPPAGRVFFLKISCEVPALKAHLLMLLIGVNDDSKKALLSAVASCITEGAPSLELVRLSESFSPACLSFCAILNDSFSMNT
jgi:hypothetical protein